MNPRERAPNIATGWLKFEFGFDFTTSNRYVFCIPSSRVHPMFNRSRILRVFSVSARWEFVTQSAKPHSHGNEPLCLAGWLRLRLLRHVNARSSPYICAHKYTGEPRRAATSDSPLCRQPACILCVFSDCCTIYFITTFLTLFLCDCL